MITQQQLKELYHYDPLTGIWTRIKCMNSRHPVGQILSAVSVRGYPKVMINKKVYMLHRLAWLYVHNYIPDVIDHDDRDKLNCKLENLKDSSMQKNSKNRKLPSNNTTGEMGICFDKSTNRYMLQVTKLNGKRINRRFNTIEEAVLARDKIYEEEEYHVSHGK